MGPTWIRALAGVTVIASSVVGGVFLAFSDFLMRALAVVGEPAGSAAMKAVNEQVFRYVFIPTFFALVPVTAGTAAAGSVEAGPWTPWLVASAVVYFFGCFLCTGAGNVPLNDKLAKLSGEAQSAFFKNTYLPQWTRLNTLRTVACLASAVCSLVAYGQLSAAS